jgi:hypothetical protein
MAVPHRSPPTIWIVLASAALAAVDLPSAVRAPDHVHGDGTGNHHGGVTLAADLSPSRQWYAWHAAMPREPLRGADRSWLAAEVRHQGEREP